MKQLENKSLTISMLFTLLLFSTLLQAAPQSYPLVCRGGGDNQTTIYNTQNGTMVFYKFKRSARGASSGVGKGECAWLDRGISSDEPGVISMTFKKAHSKVSISQKNGKLSAYKVLTWGDRESYTKLNKLMSDIKNGREFQVHAYSYKPPRGGRKLIMTKFGP
ncbi:hypothetical protein [sulfur-oxidizing endosymbiont of Gigantopelta aegis]|uniref:hypothetical protein n=1 Tax=sulfur-oxidizing endosymbiont of Gigantopelta aegis TaxID=2794934 RepID=UPI0018DC95B4|nr:hypothetical protein [sulfur-oxidizing endosymbiont of Gigantopelta aegis]